MNLLARREHSKSELRRKLEAGGYEKDVIENILHELAKENLQSDERFAENFVRARTNHGFGPIRISLELRERGVAKDVINEFIDKNSDKWQKLAMQIKEKKFGNQQGDIKQARFLQYKGFTSEQIKYTQIK